MPKSLTRRGFLKGSATAATAAFAAPRILRARGASDKVNVAIIGCGGRGWKHVAEAGKENIVALVDVSEKALAGVARRVPAAKTFSDYRKMFDTMAKSIDAVCVATPDHNHACASMMAMKRGKAVYCEKPLTWSVAEARALTEAAREHKVTTQMGNHGHCMASSRTCVEWVRAGAIGKVLETHSWTDRPWWPQGIATPLSKATPAGLNWDTWIGPAPFRHYHDGLHRFNWRGWCDFGNGALGDMACHTMDSVFWANHLGYPTSVELVTSSNIYTETYPQWTHVVWEFPDRKRPAGCKIDMPAMKVHWWDGSRGPGAGTRSGGDLADQHRPPIVLELEKTHNRKLGRNGSVFIGEKGVLHVGVHGDGMTILDPHRHAAFKKVAPKGVLPGPRSANSFEDFYASIRAGKPGYSNFDYAGPFTETVLMGNLSIRAGVGEKVLWDGKNMKVTNKPALNRYIRREYRKGWTL